MQLHQLPHFLKDLEGWLQKNAVAIIGVESVNHFSENFQRQAFNNKPWKEVKRRDPSSVWYGFEYQARSPLPSGHPKRKGSAKAYKARKSNAITNYSPTATITPILSSKQSELANSLHHFVRGDTVSVTSDKEYAKTHNEGGRISVFGNKTVTVAPRTFAGEDQALIEAIQKKLAQHIQQNFNS